MARCCDTRTDQRERCAQDSDCARADALAQHPRGRLRSGRTPMGPMQSRIVEQADIAGLIALNADYIESVQHGDVRRFEEILADDFLPSNPDGSLVNREQFLAQTALPVTI